MGNKIPKILVIRLGALGDICLSLGPMAAIRAHHPTAEIVLLTTGFFADWLKDCPYFDRLHSVPRHSRYNPLWLWRIGRWLRRERFDRIYDLQTSAHSRSYFYLLPRGNARPEWSGHIKSASHSDLVNPARSTSHTVDRQAEQLRLAGIDSVPLANFDWLPESDWHRFNLPESFALLVIGASPRPPGKKWPAGHFAELAGLLKSQLGLTPVLIGGAAEAQLAAEIAALAEVIDLTAQTSLNDLVTLAKKARLMVGNDTGPAHLMAIAGVPCLMLFSRQTHPWKAAPRGKNAHYLQVAQGESLDDLNAARVLARVQAIVSDPYRDNCHLQGNRAD
ncbi:MAG: glycosyltransferase family 9 protein [Candidatus Pacebacteria bacterium]|nr:glycosyltransferase family 9 protein [Candidatus Paceibacterota bacterium]